MPMDKLYAFLEKFEDLLKGTTAFLRAIITGFSNPNLYFPFALPFFMFIFTSLLLFGLRWVIKNV